MAQWCGSHFCVQSEAIAKRGQNCSIFLSHCFFKWYFIFLLLADFFKERKQLIFQICMFTFYTLTGQGEKKVDILVNHFYQIKLLLFMLLCRLQTSPLEERVHFCLFHTYTEVHVQQIYSTVFCSKIGTETPRCIACPGACPVLSECPQSRSSAGGTLAPVAMIWSLLLLRILLWRSKFVAIHVIRPNTFILWKSAVWGTTVQMHARGIVKEWGRPHLSRKYPDVCVLYVFASVADRSTALAQIKKFTAPAPHPQHVASTSCTPQSWTVSASVWHSPNNFPKMCSPWG